MNHISVSLFAFIAPERGWRRDESRKRYRASGTVAARAPKGASGHFREPRSFWINDLRRVIQIDLYTDLCFFEEINVPNEI